MFLVQRASIAGLDVLGNLFIFQYLVVGPSNPLLGTIFPFAGEAAKPRKFGDLPRILIRRGPARPAQGRFSRMVRGLRGDIVPI